MSEKGIVFMGTPEFAVSTLDKLYSNGINIKAVVTVPDKPAGRGQKLQSSAVKEFALGKGLKILQPEKLRSPEFLKELAELGADLFVVVAFRMLPEEVWTMAPLGTINLHASLLPNYRGAAPINWAIINGEKETGVTTFFIEKEIDTGKIIAQTKTDIDPNENVGSLYERLMCIGADLAVATVQRIINGNIDPIDQQALINDYIKPAPKIFKNDCRIDFGKSVKEVHDFVRGLSPYPAAWTILKNAQGTERSYKILAGHPTVQRVEPNCALKAGEKSVFIPCADYYFEIRELQPEGKRRMNAKEFMAGNDVSSLEVVN